MAKGPNRFVPSGKLKALELREGSGIGVSNVDAARIRYNEATGVTELSENGGPYGPIGTNGVAALVTALQSGTVGAFGATDGAIQGFDGVTPGGVKRTSLLVKNDSVKAQVPTEDLASIVLTPLGGGADDWPQENAAYLTGKAVHHSTGSFLSLSKQVVPSNTMAEYLPGATIRYDIRPIGGGNEDATPFFANAMIGVAASTYLAEVGVIGSNKIKVQDPTDTVIGAQIVMRPPVIFHCNSFLVTNRADAVTGDPHVSALVTAGATLANTNVWKLYFELDIAVAGNDAIRLYSDVAKTVLVAHATRATAALPWNAVLAADGGSGLTATLTVLAGAATDVGADNIMIVNGWLTLDAPLVYPFPYTGGGVGTDCAVHVITATACNNIKLYGHGAQLVPNVTATPDLCDKAFEIAFAWDCDVTDWRVDVSGINLLACSFDAGGVRNRFRGIEAHGLADTALRPATCITLECQRDSLVEDCHVSNALYSNLLMNSCGWSSVVNCTSDGGVVGLQLSSIDALDVYGCRNMRIRDGMYRNASNSCITVGDGSRFTLIDGVNCIGDANTQYGIRLMGGIMCAAATPCHDTTIVNSIITGGVCGLYLEQATLRNKILRSTIGGQTVYGVYVASGELHCDDLYIYDEDTLGASCMLLAVGTAGLVTGGKVTLELIGAHAAAYTVGLHAAAGGVVDIDELEIRVPTNAWIYAVSVDATATYRIGTYRQVNGQYGFYVTNTTAKIWIDHIDARGLNHALMTFAGGATQAQCNFGSSVLVAGTVNVPCLWAKAGMVVELTPTAFAGTPNPLRVSAITDGVSFDITSDDAADTSTVAWHIISVDVKV